MLLLLRSGRRLWLLLRRRSAAHFVKHVSEHSIDLSGLALNLLLPCRVAHQLFGNYRVTRCPTSASRARFEEAAPLAAAISGVVTDAVGGDVGVRLS